MLGTDVLVPVALFASIVVVILGLARTVSEGRTRRRIIESGGSPEFARLLAESEAYRRAHPPALMWGVVAVAAGAAFVVMQFLPFGGDDPIMAGVLLLFVGAGLLLYHALTRSAGTGAAAARTSSLPPAHPAAAVLPGVRTGDVENAPAAPTTPQTAPQGAPAAGTANP